MKSRSLVVTLLLSLIACSERPAGPPAPSGVTSREAVAIVSELPEAKAWTKYIYDNTNGKAHAEMMVIPEQPVTIEGQRYWSVNFYENQTDHLHRWQTFMVRLDGQEILADEEITGEYIGLQEWRERSGRPHGRTGAGF